MRVFEGISQEGETTLVSAAAAVVERLSGLHAPRSLCEIRTDEDDYRWLCAWAQKLRPQQVRRWLDGLTSHRVTDVGGYNLTYSEALGCMFLLLASETARREASEGFVWSAVRKSYPKLIESRLFIQGHPKATLKDAMEASARKLNLRNVYGQEGTQEYYLSIYLQFGFTRKGMARLPHWLAGQGTSESIQYLTGMRGHANRSESFVAFWDVLRNYRRNNITADHARSAVMSSPWVLPEWADDLLKRSQDRPELGTADPGRLVETEETPPEFLSPPILRWDMPAASEFVCDIVNLADFDLTADRYVVRSGKQVLARLFESRDGGYRSDPEQLVIPAAHPEFTATIVDDAGDSPGSQLVTLWDSMEEVELFNLNTGRLVPESDGFQLGSGSRYGLLASADLEVEPAGLRFHLVGSGDYPKKLYLVEGGATQDVSVRLEGEEIWRSGSPASGRDTRVEPDWAASVTPQLTPSNRLDLSGDPSVSVSVFGLDDDTSVTYVRIGARPLGFERLEDGAFCTENFNILSLLSPKSANPGLEVKIGLRRQDERANVTRNLALQISGALRFTADGWQSVPPSDPMPASDAKQYAYRILPPPSDRRGDLALMEGPVLLRRLWTMPRPFDSIGGYGAPLSVRAPYNWVERDDLLTISDEVYDPGFIEAYLADSEGSVTLWLSQPLEPGELHSVAFWSPGAPPFISPAQGAVSHPDGSLDVWDVQCPEWFSDSEGLVAISYDGVRLGGNWPAVPFEIAAVDDGGALQTAAMLRWLHAPIVSRAWIEPIRKFAHRHPAAALRAWLGDDGLPDTLSHADMSDHWMSAVRQIFSEWTPSASEAVSILNELGQEAGQGNSYAALWKLSRLTPILMGKVVRALIKFPQVRGGIHTMRLQMAELPPEAIDADIGTREGELLNQVADLMGMNATFLERGIAHRALDSLDGSTLSVADRRNLETALNVPPFREYLSLRILSRLANSG